MANNDIQQMSELLAKQKAANLRDGIPSAQTRIDWIERCIGLLVDHQTEICDAMAEDFGHRSKDQSAMTDIAGSIGPLKFAKKNVRKWMKDESRASEFPLGLLGAKSKIHYQPKGVVGVISPWNFPVQLTFSPLAGILSAGNRAMIKPSEFTEHTSKLLKQIFAKAFTEEEIAIVTGGPEVGAEFTKLPFDHMLFTGATSIAKHVMRAAAENLVPLTLELGGKSPVIVGRTADLNKAAKRIMAGKTLNSGQICLAPDYILIAKENKEAFIEAARAAVEELYPSGIINNDDYTSIVNERHYERINSYITDAKEKGAEVVALNPQNEDQQKQENHKVIPHIIVDANDDMSVMQDEIFGPILPIKTYDHIQEAIDYVNDHDRPLALYYFGSNKAEQEDVLNNTISGGVTINDVIFHVSQEDLPFGGIGPSGMGFYHGKEGFHEFSHKRSIFKQPNAELLAILRPPYGKALQSQLKRMIKR